MRWYWLLSASRMRLPVEEIESPALVVPEAVEEVKELAK
jgi:hypothetical protein